MGLEIGLPSQVCVCAPTGYFKDRSMAGMIFYVGMEGNCHVQAPIQNKCGDPAGDTKAGGILGRGGRAFVSWNCCHKGARGSFSVGPVCLGLTIAPSNILVGNQKHTEIWMEVQS